MTSVRCLLIFLLLFVVLTICNGFLLGNRHICYNDVGCFANNKPFNNALDALPSSPKDIKIINTLYHRGNSGTGSVIIYNDESSISKAGYDGTKPTKFVIHGYMSMATEPWVLNMTQGFLRKGDFNVITVNWQNGAHQAYEQSVANTRVVGAVTALLLTTLRDKFGARMEDVHIAGHSLGAQTAGYVGTRIPNLGRITGLDPAGPLFEQYAPEVRLDPSDALFIDVIHTDAAPLHDAGFGTKKPSGHIDFYPNGGGHQAGCPPPVRSTLEELLTLRFTEAFDAVACSHDRSYFYFMESMFDGNCKFTGYPCSSYSDFEAGNCNSCGASPCPSMGYDAYLSNRTGSYYLDTNSIYPYCR